MPNSRKIVAKWVNVPSFESMKDRIVKPEGYMQMLVLMYQYGLINQETARQLGVREESF